MADGFAEVESRCILEFFAFSLRGNNLADAVDSSFDWCCVNGDGECKDEGEEEWEGDGIELHFVALFMVMLLLNTIA